ETVVTVAAAVVFGMVLALLGSLKLAMAKRLGLGEGDVSGLFVALNLALIPVVILAGMATDLGGVAWTLVLGSMATSIGLFSLGWRPTYGGVLGALLMAGLGSAGVSTASMVLMPKAFFGPRLITASVSLGMVFIALGALMTPPLMALL